MKKFGKYFVVAMIVVAATAAVLVGCKKDEQTSGEQEKSVSGYDETQQPSESEDKIISFINDYEGMKKGEKAEGEALSLEEARWQWETTLNYCYGFTQSHLRDMRCDTVYVAMPKANTNDKIAYDDLLQTYADIIDAVREQYKAIEIEDKTLMFVTMSIEENTAKDADKNVAIIMNTGSDCLDNMVENHTPWYGVPFQNNICWHWGLELGSCTYPYILHGDASDEIMNAIASYDRSHETPHVDCLNCETYVEDIHQVAIYGWPNLEDHLFYAEHLTWDEVLNYCICPDDMNMYYAWIMEKTHYNGMIINPYDIDWYYYVDIRDCRYNNNSGSDFTIYHIAIVSNGTRRFRVNRGYPQMIDME